MNPTASDIAIISVIVGLRFLLPLLIPLYPLPAILACLVVDAVDQTVFQTQLSAGFWLRIQDGYQGYDKALDVYYLSLAYLSMFRNWDNQTAFRVGRFLLLYRLSGAALFETLHDSADQSSWRWLLLIFPNTFEYFFIGYEAFRIRWDPRRVPARAVMIVAAFIWIVIKLPQEWWIHVAELDFTNVADDYPWLLPTLYIVGALAIVSFRWAMKHILPRPDWALRLKADPIPTEVDDADKRDRYRAAMWKVLSWRTTEKIALVTLITIVFAAILPNVDATPTQILMGAAVFVVLNSMAGLSLSRRSWSLQVGVLQFFVVVGLNLALVEAFDILSVRFIARDATFFVLLLSLIVTFYDRYRPMYEVRVYNGDFDYVPRPAALRTIDAEPV
ncbi:MAG: hypothetical protein JWN20_1115 [Jatrophihabitantaceae bacterium]|nr:hypothetical protein [Jatrophihabitantaceae bacterium]